MGMDISGFRGVENRSSQELVACRQVEFPLETWQVASASEVAAFLICFFLSKNEEQACLTQAGRKKNLRPAQELECRDCLKCLTRSLSSAL